MSSTNKVPQTKPELIELYKKKQKEKVEVEKKRNEGKKTSSL